MYGMLLMVAMSGSTAAPLAYGAYGCGDNQGCGHGCNTGCATRSCGNRGCGGGCNTGCNRGCGGGCHLFSGCGHRSSCGGGCNDGGSCGGAGYRMAGVIINPNQAVVVVDVPADAKLYLDNVETQQTGTAQRRFVTPALEAGADYAYEIRTEVFRDGKTITETKTVTVRAGAVSRASFSAPAAVVAAK